MKKLFILLVMVCAFTKSFSQTINRAEYFFDHDPGQGNGNAIAINSPGELVNFSVNIPLSGIGNGFHLLGARVCDTEGTWSWFEFRSIYVLSPANLEGTQIVAAEYFFDSDPGAGKGIPVSIGAATDIVNLAVVIPANLSSGFHWIGIRTKNSEGKWGLFDRRNFFLTAMPVDMTAITGAEYFIDQDPGAGNATQLTINAPGITVSQAFSIPIPATIPTGKHWLAIRVKDQAGNWSLFEKDSLTVNPAAATISCPGDTTATATGFECVAAVNGIDPTLTPAGSSYTYTLTGATTANGSGTVSGRAFNVGTTTVNYALSSSPGSSCSFKVTVNSGVVPSVSIYTPVTDICSGTEVYFLAMPVNGGFTPTYQWKRNGINVGTNSNMYYDSTLADGDSVTVEMNTSISCASQAPVTSNAIRMKVTQTQPVTVNIQASSTAICPGQSITFTAVPGNPGNSPTYLWRVNNRSSETNSAVFQTSDLQDGDSVSVLLYSSARCHLGNVAESDWIKIKVNATLSPSISISASQTAICSGQQVTFTANPVYGGTNPVYEWTLNNNAVGTNSAMYQNSSLKNGDVVKLTMSSSLSCANPVVVSSNAITMSVSAGSVFYRDADGDGYGNPNNTAIACTPPQGFVSDNTDCDDSNAAMHPGAIESCNGVDDDCDGLVDEGAQPVTWYRDVDGDGFGNASLTQIGCTKPGGYVSNNTDCNDSNAAIYPGRIEICNGIDDDCDGLVDELVQATYYRDMDGDGYGSSSSGSVQGCSAPQGYVSNNSDCNDNNPAVNPGHAEICQNGIDDGCDGLIDENCITTRLAKLVLRTYPVKEGNVGETSFNLVVQLDTVTQVNASVYYATEDADARAGRDYIAASGLLTIPAGSLSATILVRIMGDVWKEGNEKFILRFSQPSNIMLTNDSVSTVLILDDDRSKKEEQLLVVPSVARRNQVWFIPDISGFENEVFIMDVNGQVVHRVANYNNQRTIGNLALGLYFYRIRIIDREKQVKYYSGRLLVTE